MEKSSNPVRNLRKHFASLLEPTYGHDEANALIMILFEHHFKINRIDIALNPDLCLNNQEYAIIEKSVEELLTNRPVQYITGETEFCGMRFSVNENVLIPRPETEELVSLILSADSGQLTTGKINVLDIGTGSGCIAISLAKSLKDCVVTAVDISDKALEVAKKNARANEADVRFVMDDILSPQSTELTDNKFDIIVSNPPYVCDSEKRDMRANVLDFEPSTALFVSDDDPLLFYREIVNLAQHSLKPDGTVWFEINERFGEDMVLLCRNNGFSNTSVFRDFRDKDRFIRARR